MIDHAAKELGPRPHDGDAYWVHSPYHASPPGEYVIVVKMQGQNVQPARITLWVWGGECVARVAVDGANRARPT